MPAAVKLGNDFVVNTSTETAQFDPVIAKLSNGGFVVAWTDSEPDLAPFSDVRAQVFNASGSPVGEELLVNTVTSNQQHQPTIAGLSDGGFVVAWADQGGADGNLAGIFAQVFNSNGLPSGTQLPVNTQTVLGQLTPAVSALADGGFVVAWEDERNATDGSGSAVRARVFAGSGFTPGNEFPVNTTTSGAQFAPAVATLANGRFVVTWDDHGVALGVLRAQIFEPNGAPVGSEFQVNTTPSVEEFNLTIASFSDGRFFAAWNAGGDVRGQIFDANGNKVGLEFVLNTKISGGQDVPAIAGLSTGRFVAVWQDTGPGAVLGDTSAGGLVGQVFNMDGSKFGSEFLVTTTTFASQLDPTITALDDGRFAVAFEDGANELRVQIVQTGVIRNGTEGADALHGTAADDLLAGNGGNDVLNGGAGFDTLTGGQGNDTYFVDNAGDVATEMVGGGSDTVIATVNYTLQAGSEIETLSTTSSAGTAAINLTGNAFNNLVTGNAAANVLNGGGGIDKIYGFAGNDTYFVDNAGDQVNETAGNGSDTVIATVNYTLKAGSEIETLSTTSSAGTAAINLTGNAFNNLVTGNAAANVLNGGGGIDKMYGFAGNDTYFVDNAGDQVNETAGNGSDTVIATVNYTLKAGSEIETLSTTSSAGTAAINLTGNAFNNLVTGNAAANVLNGGGGIDKMYGFAGNDTYFVDNAGDQVNETAGNGSDTVIATVNYTLKAGSEIETLSTTSSAGTAAINLTGNAFNNLVTGNAAANVLNGGGGIDKMYGFAGNDTYFVDNAGDQVNETAGNGSDTVIATVNYTLKAGSEIETLSTTSSAGTAAINLTGNAFNNLVTGNAAANAINGGLGNDTLYGFGGNDAFVFNTALNAATNVDRLSDFSVPDDTMWLDNAVFTTLAAGALAAGAFSTGTGATQADDRIVYNSGTGALFYDADGNGAGGAIQFATLATGLPLTAADFFVF